MTTTNPYIILGNGGAACHGVISLREHGYAGPLLMISDCDEAAFNPMLGPYFLKGVAQWENCYPFGVDFYARYNVETVFGTPVTALDAAKKQITLSNGVVYEYAKCLVATGAGAAMPPVKGLRETTLALPLRDSASTLKMAEALKEARRVVVMGASLVGVKLAEILCKLGAEVLLVDVAAQVMPKGAHPISADYLQQYFQRQGIRLKLNCAMQEVIEANSKLTCVLPDEIVGDIDFVAVCTGIRSNIQFINREQVDVDLGILIDRNSQTSVPGLYAAGDCAQGHNLFSGKRDWLGTWSNACYQGRAAGAHMAGVEEAYACPLQQHVSPFFDWSYVQMGDVYRTGDNVRLVTGGNPFEGGFSLLVYENDVLVGANLFNDMTQLGCIKKSLSLKQNYTDNSFIMDCCI